MNTAIITNFPLTVAVHNRLNKQLGSVVNNKRLFSSNMVGLFSESEHYDLCIVWLNFALFYPEFLSDLLVDPDMYDKIIDSCVDLTQFICRQAYDKCGEVILATYEDMNQPFANISDLCGKADITREINRRLVVSLRELIGSISFADSEYIGVKIGQKNIRPRKAQLRWGIPYGEDYLNAMVDEFVRLYGVAHNAGKKCLVLDCDNVLWGGILGETDSNCVKLSNYGEGKRYTDFQRFLKLLYRSGVILAVCSKNDSDSVEKIFENHSGMVLKKEDIAVFRVNRHNKAQNILEIAMLLNLSISSMVFIDDSPTEIGGVKSVLSDLDCILFDPYTIYQELEILSVKWGVDQKNVEWRMASYRSANERLRLRGFSVSHEDFIKAIEAETVIRAANSNEYDRMAQLSQRTNKFNYSGRYSYAQLSQMVSRQGVRLYSIYFKDKFCDHGLVGAIGIDGNTVVLCCLSCRVLGCGAEEKIIEFLKNEGCNDDIIGWITANTHKDKV